MPTSASSGRGRPAGSSRSSSPGAASASSCSSQVRGTTSRAAPSTCAGTSGTRIRGRPRRETSIARRSAARFRTGSRADGYAVWAAARCTGRATRSGFHASDFRMRSLYGIADDWPISYADLESLLRGRRADARRRRRRRRAPGLASQHSLPVAPVPVQLFRPAVRSGVRDGWASPSITCRRPGTRWPTAAAQPCRACSTCAVCPTGAKASIDLTSIPEAEATGNARDRHRGHRAEARDRPLGAGERRRLRWPRQGAAAADRPRVRGRRRRGRDGPAPAALGLPRLSGAAWPTGAAWWASSSCRIRRST